jgi:NAD(P)-dependent dehydrogenase (short-subunit alcohol dehydrogenase family)
MTVSSRPADPVVLVTGASGNAGRAVAAAFYAEGARLGLAGSNLGRLDDVARDLALADDRWTPAVADFRDRSEARAAIERVVDRFGRIDILAHLIGGWSGGTPVVDLDPAAVTALLDPHLWATLNVVQAVLPGMLDRGWGRLIAISSPFAAAPPAGGGAYAIAKSAEEALFHTIAREVAGAGVTANVLVVKKIDPTHVRETDPTPKNAAWTTPEEIAATMGFLCSDGAAAINGTRIPLDGR